MEGVSSCAPLPMEADPTEWFGDCWASLRLSEMEGCSRGVAGGISQEPAFSLPVDSECVQQALQHSLTKHGSPPCVAGESAGCSTPCISCIPGWEAPELSLSCFLGLLEAKEVKSCSSSWRPPLSNPSIWAQQHPARVLPSYMLCVNLEPSLF